MNNLNDLMDDPGDSRPETIGIIPPRRCGRRGHCE
jgi:hypothetical protein